MKTIFPLMGLLTLLTFASSCTKDFDRLSSPDGPVPMVRPPVTTKGDKPAFPRLLPDTKCINSYAELVAVLGGTSVQIASVVLDNGQTVTADGDIISIRYSISNTQESHSLFRSILQVDHAYYGFVQTSLQETWSLGCVYPWAGVPPFANLFFRNTLYTINAGITWSIPPLNGTAHRVTLLVAR